MEEKGYFNKICLCRVISVPSFFLQWQGLLSSWYGTEEGDSFTRGILCPASRQKGEGQRVPSVSTVSQLFQGKINLIPKRPILRWPLPAPFIMNQINDSVPIIRMRTVSQASCLPKLDLLLRDGPGIWSKICPTLQSLLLFCYNTQWGLLCGSGFPVNISWTLRNPLSHCSSVHFLLWVTPTNFMPVSWEGWSLASRLTSCLLIGGRVHATLLDQKHNNVNSAVLRGTVIQSNLGHNNSCQISYFHGGNYNTLRSQVHKNYSAHNSMVL